MKRIAILAMLLIAAVYFGCTKIKSIADINVNIPYSTTISVPQINGYQGGVILPQGGLVLDFPPVGVQTNSQSYMDQYHTSASMVRMVNMQSLSMDILSPASQNFDFLDTVQLYISTKERPEVLVAYKYGITKNSRTLDFVVLSSVNLKDYFLADSMFMRMRAHINATPASGTQLKVSTQFHLLANPLY